MKVPTYSKYGLKKFEIEEADEHDRKVTHLLTHTLPLLAGGALGILVFFIYFFKSGQATVFQVFYQAFLFGTIGIVCVGIPMAFFVIAERLYFHYRSKNNSKYRTIQDYKDDRDSYDFWKIRMDESFWRMLDGLSIEKEVINIFMHKGYALKNEFETEDGEHDHLLEKDGKLMYLDFKTDRVIESIEYINTLIANKAKSGADTLVIFSKFGFAKKVKEMAIDKSVEMLTFKDLIKSVKEVEK